MPIYNCCSACVLNNDIHCASNSSSTPAFFFLYSLYFVFCSTLLSVAVSFVSLRSLCRRWHPPGLPGWYSKTTFGTSLYSHDESGRMFSSGKKNRQAACAFRIPTCVLCVSIRLWRGPPDVYMCMCVGFSVDSTFRVSGGDRTTYAISVDSSPKGVEDLLLPSFRMLRTLTTGCAHGLV